MALSCAQVPVFCWDADTQELQTLGDLHGVMVQEVLSMRLKKKTPKEEKLKKHPLTHQHQILSFGAIA